MILIQEINSENFLKIVHSNGRLLQKPCFKLLSEISIGYCQFKGPMKDEFILQQSETSIGDTVEESMAISGDKCKTWEQSENFYVFCCILSFLLRILRKLITNFNFDPKKVLQRINAMITNKVNNFQDEFIHGIQSNSSKECVARSLCPIFMIDPSNDSSR